MFKKLTLIVLITLSVYSNSLYSEGYAYQFQPLDLPYEV